MKTKSISIIIGLLVLTVNFFACETTTEMADLVMINGTVYTANEEMTKAEAIAVKAGKVLKVGPKDLIQRYIDDSTLVLDMHGKFIFPGFIEGHAHIMGIGANKINVDLMSAKSFDEVVEMVKARAQETPKGTWIFGRGWHQDKWEQIPENMFEGFPTHHKLSEAVPDHPVWLSHASGHASLANAKAMEIAGVNKSTPNPPGGEVLKDVSGSPTGVFNETAENLIAQFMPEGSKEQERKKLQLAIDECLQYGITGFHQAGSGAADIALFKEFAEQDQLKLRLHVMLHGLDSALLQSYYQQGPQSGLYDDHLNIRSIKLYADGALGSRGAWLLEDYEDAEGVHGHNVTPMDKIAGVVEEALQNGFQVCTHAIGDRANREVLDIYERAFQRNPQAAKNHRFRIEHAQHIHPEDIPRFAELEVIPAMQAIHMSSDRPWAIDRLGKERIESGAYVWNALIEQGSKIVNGTDAPVEPVNPLACFYASVTRKTLSGKPEGGYEPQHKMTREEALKSYTIWAAYGAFMENLVGSIEEGKLADFTVFDQDIMTISETEILNTRVEMTIIGGEVVYARN